MSRGQSIPMDALWSHIFSVKTLRIREFYQHCYLNSPFSIKYSLCLFLAFSDFYFDFYCYLHFDFVNCVCVINYPINVVFFKRGSESASLLLKHKCAAESALFWWWCWECGFNHWSRRLKMPTLCQLLCLIQAINLFKTTFLPIHTSVKKN